MDDTGKKEHSALRSYYHSNCSTVAEGLRLLAGILGVEGVAPTLHPTPEVDTAEVNIGGP